MKILENLKNNYAQEQGYEDWYELYMLTDSIMVFQMHMNEICIRAQKAALENAAESVTSGSFRSQSDYIITCKDIINPENLIQ